MLRGGQNRREAEETLLSFTLIPVLGPLSNCDRQNRLIDVGTEGDRNKDYCEMLA